MNDLIEGNSLSGARERISCTAQLEGIVEHGDARSRELGYPAANSSVQDREIRDKVWAGTVHLGHEGLHETCPAAIIRRGLVRSHCIGNSQLLPSPPTKISPSRSTRLADSNDVACVRSWAAGYDRESPA